MPYKENTIEQGETVLDFWERSLPCKKVNYSLKEVQFYLETLILNKRSAILNDKK